MDELTGLALRAAGDPVAAAAFIRASQAEVWRLCASLTDTQAADDLAQETFIRALRALPDFEGRSSARTWLLSIARRTAVDHIRSSVRRRRLTERLVHSEVEQLAPDPASSVTADQLLAALEPDRRAAFVVTQVLGLPYAEAAEVLGCPIGTVRSRVARARIDLVRLVEQSTAAG
jgi:RNA polymerase sigma-70 factor (ECF subfamily)